MEIDEEKLINVVSAYGELYDLQHEHYMNQQRKANIWKEIGTKMGVSAQICKERWKSLRDGYNRSIKRRKTKSGDGAKTSKAWRYEKQMDFLRPFFQERPVKSNLETSVSTEEDSNSTSHSTPTIDVDALSATSTPASTSSAMFSEITKRKMSKAVQQKSEVANVLQQYLDKRGNQTATASSRSPIHSFFIAMADTVVNFPPDIQLKVKNEIYSTVSQAEYDFQICQPSLPKGRQNISRSEIRDFHTDTPSPEECATQTSENVLNIQQYPHAYQTPHHPTLETPATPSTPEECPSQTSQNVLSAPKRQYYITTDGLMLRELF